jgi:hypothetical protein
MYTMQYRRKYFMLMYILRFDRQYLLLLLIVYKKIRVITWLTLFKEIIAVYTENCTKSINTASRVNNCKGRWYL